MRKCALVVFIALLALSLSPALCLSQADRTVADTSKKGSLLIWPLVKYGPANTTVILSNNYYEGVKVKCFFRSSFPFHKTSWLFNLLPNQTIAWLASTGKGPDGKNIPSAGNAKALSSGTSGELRCWAVDETGYQQIAWNWLSGGAIIKEGNNQSWEYSAWRFAVNSSTTGADAGPARTLQLTGNSGNYDACPTGLMFTFLKQTSTFSEASFPKGTVNNVLTLVPCKEDYLANSAPGAYTDFVVRDEDGTSRSGASACIGSTTSATQWFSESFLSSKIRLESGVINPFPDLATPGGTVYIHGKVNTHCTPSSGVPLIGVMSMQFMSNTGPVVGVPPTAAGEGQAYIKDKYDINTVRPITIRW